MASLVDLLKREVRRRGIASPSLVQPGRELIEEIGDIEGPKAEAELLSKTFKGELGNAVKTAMQLRQILARVTKERKESIASTTRELSNRRERLRRRALA